MAMGEGDFELLSRHLRRFLKKAPCCPICGGDSWGADGPIVLHACVVDGGEAELVPNRGIPAAVLVCEQCAFVLYFSWRAVVEAVGTTLQ